MASDLQTADPVQESSRTPCGCGRGRDEELLREVRHAAGNLVQRMHYLTVLLEDQAAGSAARESLAGMRGSLDSLYRLVVRSLDLFRAIEVRPIGIPLGDVVTGITLRFGGTAELGTHELAAARACEVWVDPLVLERAVGMLWEALSAGPATNGRTVASISIERAENTGAPVQAVVDLALQVRRELDEDTFAHVHARVSLALALSLLEGLELHTLVTQDGDDVSVRITLPLRAVAQRDSRSMHSTRSRDSRETLPL